MTNVYFVRIDGGKWQEVSKQEFVRNERMAGFRNTMGERDEPATNSFSSSPRRGHSIEGRRIERS